LGTLTDTLAQRAVDRSVADRQSEFTREMQRILDATYSLIERTGSLDPSLRDILRETGLSTQAFYKYFRSKDELMLLLLDDGRRRLLGYLDHRMDKATTLEGRVRAWIEGVLAQAGDPAAAARTRPFLANQDRLAEAFPEEQQASVDLLIDQLAGSLERLTQPTQPTRSTRPTRMTKARMTKARRAETRRDAEAIYHMVFGMLRKHLIQGTRPTGVETDHLVRFTLRAAGTPTDPKKRS
jgi:AcrR family transcriptional regulator